MSLANFTKKRIDVLIRRTYMRHLRVIGPVIAIYYGLLVLGHYLVLAGGARNTMMGAAALASVYFLITTYRVLAAKIRISEVHVWGGLGVAIVMLNVFLHVHMTADSKDFFNITVAVIAFGFVVLSPRIYIAMIVISFILYMLTLWHLSMFEETHILFMFVTCVFISLVGFFMRYRSILAQSELTVENRRRGYIAHREKKVAEAASESKTRFLANTSHELRTPLTGVLGMLQLLKDTKLDAEQQKLVDVADTSAETLLRLINDILDSAALENGRLRLDNKGFSLHSVIESVRHVLSSRAADKDLVLKLRHSGDVEAPMMGDPVRLGQVIYNLVGNALKFTSEGYVTIDYSVEQGVGDAKGSLISVIKVADTGQGIPRDECAKLFDRFHQVDDSRVRAQTGTGLGLAICREILGLMGGTIGVASEVGKGSIFTVKLNLPEADQADQDTVSLRASDLPADLAHMADRPLKILVAEDNKVNQLLITRLFEKMPQWHITLVNDGTEALASATDQHAAYDALVLDIQMPNLDGLGAIAAISDKLGNARPPAIALTANVSDDDLAAHRDAGFLKSVGKPIDRSKLFSAIARVVHNGEIARRA